MHPQRASLRIAHQAKCVHANRTAVESLTGCTCKPRYYVSWQDSAGATNKSPRVGDRREAEKELTYRQHQLDVGRTEPERRARKAITFPAWVDEYLGIIETRGLKGETLRGYAKTLEVASEAIGHKDLRQIDNSDLRRYLKDLGEVADATKVQHMKHLSACLATALAEGYAEVNPVPAFRKTLKLKVPKQGSAPFQDVELDRLWQAMLNPVKKGRRAPEAVYLAICKLAVATGARQGELIALTWDDLNLTEGVLRITKQYNQIDGVIQPKDNEERLVYLTPDAVDVFGWWVRECGAQATGLIFEAPRSGGYVNDDYLRRVLTAAMDDAGIPKVDADSGLKRSFHSFRRTYTRQMLETGHHPQWVQANLGHASLELTVNTYGTWSTAAMRAEAQGSPV